MWNATGERRQLPSLWEWISISILTRHQLWTESQQRMMRSATRYYAVIAALLTTILLVFLLGGLQLAGMTQDVLMGFRARCASVLMAVGYDEAVWPLLTSSSEPSLRTSVIHGASQVLNRPDDILAQIDEQQDVSARHGHVASRRGTAGRSVRHTQ